MLDIGEAVDVLGQPETRIILVPNIKRDHVSPALAGLETEIPIAGADISQGNAAHVGGQLKFVP